jgi:hypothetical protein
LERSEFGLHIQCPWRICEQRGRIAVGSSDYDDTADALTLRDRHLDDLVAAWSPAPPLLARVLSDEAGSLTLVLSNGYRLEVFPSSSIPDDEQWRLLKLREDRHFVVYGGGTVEDD